LKRGLIYKYITAVVFLAAFLAQSFGKSFYIADYYTRTARYAEKCINKARPKLHCNGQCQLMKKLQEEEKKDQQNPERNNSLKNEVSLSDQNSFATLEKQFRLIALSRHIEGRPEDVPAGIHAPVFRPPCL
jgi:hypothetical protein